MSSFFLHLAQRTLGQVELIRPLAPSRYAAAAPSGMPGETLSEHQVRLDTLDDQTTAAPRVSPGEGLRDMESPTPPTVTTSAIHPAPRATEEPGTLHEDQEPEVELADSGTPSSESIAATPVPRHPGDTSTDRSSAGPGGSHPISRQTAAEASVPARAPDSLQGHPAHRPARSDTGIGMLEPDGTIAPADVPLHPLRPRVEAGTLARETTPDQDSRPAPTPRTRTDPVAQKPASEPVIEVHIGRIEVHAARQPVPADPAGPQLPGLSLADYLGRRNGGRR
jgi:hypothetical protein